MGFKLKTADVDKAKFRRHGSFFERIVPEGGWCRNFKQKKPGA